MHCASNKHVKKTMRRSQFQMGDDVLPMLEVIGSSMRMTQKRKAAVVGQNLKMLAGNAVDDAM